MTRLFSSTLNVTKLPKSQYRPFTEAMQNQGSLWVWAWPMREGVAKYRFLWLSPYAEWSRRIYLCSLSHKICTQMKRVCFVIFKSYDQFAVDSYNPFTHIIQGYFTGTGVIVYMIAPSVSKISRKVKPLGTWPPQNTRKSEPWAYSAQVYCCILISIITSFVTYGL